MGTNSRDSDTGAYTAYFEDMPIPEGKGVRNEDLVGRDRAAAVRGRYLARTSDLTDEQAEAVAWRELGYSTRAIARQLDRAKGTVGGWFDRTAAQYCLCAIETKWPAVRGDLTPITREHLLKCAPAVRLQYVEVAERYPGVVPPEVMETVGELNEYGTRSSGPKS